MSSARSSSLRLLLLLVFVATLGHRAYAKPTAPSAPSAPTDAKKEEAKQRFERGMQLLDKKLWDAALAEFLESRAAYATRSNTQNAAICLRNLNRFDEALAMFETLEKEFPNLPDRDREAVDKEIGELRDLVGTIEVRGGEPGASILIDGRDRGVIPEAALRVGAGSHTIRVYKEGFQPFEARVEVAGKQSVIVEAKLDALSQSGRLSITEDGGKGAEVVVDNVVVGKTPWQGPVAVGEHVVFLRGEGILGTQPAAATVRINQVTPIVLALEPLECPLRVTPTPSGAKVAIDGVLASAGLWDGRLRKGRHKIEVAQEGFIPQARAVDLAPARDERLAIQLERDPDSPLWRVEKPPRVFVELAPSFPLAIVLGGDVTSSGSASFPLGVDGRAHLGYELRSGIGFGVDAGYVYIARVVNGSDTTIFPVGKAAVPGTARDRLSLHGFLLGAAAHLHRPLPGSEKFTLLFRFGVGALLGTMNDRRSGQFASIDVDTTRTDATATYLYLAPEARLGYRVADHIEVSAGLDLTLMVALKEPRWDPSIGPVLGAQGLATYANGSLLGSTVVVANPGIGVRFEF